MALAAIKSHEAAAPGGSSPPEPRDDPYLVRSSLLRASRARLWAVPVASAMPWLQERHSSKGDSGDSSASSRSSAPPLTRTGGLPPSAGPVASLPEPVGGPNHATPGPTTINGPARPATALGQAHVGSESVRSVRIRSTTLARLLHGFVLLPSGISGTGNAMI